METTAGDFFGQLASRNGFEGVGRRANLEAPSSDADTSTAPSRHATGVKASRNEGEHLAAQRGMEQVGARGSANTPRVSNSRL